MATCWHPSRCTVQYRCTVVVQIALGKAKVRAAGVSVDHDAKLDLIRVITLVRVKVIHAHLNAAGDTDRFALIRYMRMRGSTDNYCTTCTAIRVMA